MADVKSSFPQSRDTCSGSASDGEPTTKRRRRDEGDGVAPPAGTNAATVAPEVCLPRRREASQAAGSVVAWRADAGGGPRGLAQEAERRRRLLLLLQQKGEEAVLTRDAAGQAIGCRDNSIHLTDDMLANGFHSCDSDEDDRTSHASSSDWTPRPRIGPYTFVQQHLLLGTDPRTILQDLLPEAIPPPELDDVTLWQIVINLLSEPPKRRKRKDINTIEDAVKLLQECNKIIVLTGAGVSVSCGIPDFRSRDGIYARLAVDFPDLPDPQAMFDIDYFRKDPRPFFKFAKMWEHEQRQVNKTQIDVAKNTAGLK